MTEHTTHSTPHTENPAKKGFPFKEWLRTWKNRFREDQFPNEPLPVKNPVDLEKLKKENPTKEAEFRKFAEKAATQFRERAKNNPGANPDTLQLLSSDIINEIHQQFPADETAQMNIFTMTRDLVSENAPVPLPPEPPQPPKDEPGKEPNSETRKNDIKEWAEALVKLRKEYEADGNPRNEEIEKIIEEARLKYGNDVSSEIYAEKDRLMGITAVPEAAEQENKQEDDKQKKLGFATVLAKLSRIPDVETRKKNFEDLLQQMSVAFPNSNSPKIFEEIGLMAIEINSKVQESRTTTDDTSNEDTEQKTDVVDSEADQSPEKIDQQQTAVTETVQPIPEITEATEPEDPNKVTNYDEIRRRLFASEGYAPPKPRTSVSSKSEQPVVAKKVDPELTQITTDGKAETTPNEEPTNPAPENIQPETNIESGLKQEDGKVFYNGKKVDFSPQTEAKESTADEIQHMKEMIKNLELNVNLIPGQPVEISNQRLRLEWEYQNNTQKGANYWIDEIVDFSDQGLLILVENQTLSDEKKYYGVSAVDLEMLKKV